MLGKDNKVLDFEKKVDMGEVAEKGWCRYCQDPQITEMIKVMKGIIQQKGEKIQRRRKEGKCMRYV